MAFGVSPKHQQEQIMETKKYRQFGTFSVALMLPLTLLFAGLLVRSVFTNGPELIIYAILEITFLICLLIFYKLTIKIDRSNVSFTLGIGLVTKSYKISDIKLCKPVTNSVFQGIGIRMLPNGWLYNVSGLKAIELHFHHKNSIVRIGTDKPEEISQIIQSLIGKENQNGESVTVTRTWTNYLWIGVVLLIPAFIAIPYFRETETLVDNHGIKIKGVYGVSIPYTDIQQIDTVSFLPDISYRTNGYALGNTLIGNFKLSDGNRVKLFIKEGFTPYILIKSKEQMPVYLNFKERLKTIELYRRLIKRQ
jgi:hypothetical protein